MSNHFFLMFFNRLKHRFQTSPRRLYSKQKGCLTTMLETKQRTNHAYNFFFQDSFLFLLHASNS
jgi:hypothetical protein